MPELPEVETVITGLREQALNCTIKDIKTHYPDIINGDKENFRVNVIDHRITRFNRHGKYIFIELDNSKAIVNHLRMTGQLFVTDRSYAPDKHTHLEFELVDSDRKIVYRDVRKFGRFELIGLNDFQNYLDRKKLAEDAMRIDFETFKKNLGNRTKNLKASLLDQSIIAGLGNIYADEVLIREKISPLLPVNLLKDSQIKKLLKTIKEVLEQAVAGKGTSISDYVNSYGERGNFQLTLLAYGREGEPCPHCRKPIEKTRVAGRGTYFCPKCQKL